MKPQRDHGYNGRKLNTNVVELAIILSTLFSILLLILANRFFAGEYHPRSPYSYVNFLIPPVVRGVCKRYDGNKAQCIDAANRGLACLWYENCSICRDNLDKKLPTCKPKK